MISAYMNWSGGKDSSLCLYKVLKDGQLDVCYLLTSINKTYDRIAMHGVRSSLLVQQANSIGIPLQLLELPEQPDMEQYEKAMLEKVNELKSKQIENSIFGDIFLEDLRKYREEKLQAVGIKSTFPLWKTPTKDLMKEFIDVGFKAIIVCINGSLLDKSFCGRIIDQSFIDDLPPNVDVCGENGEYHSFVFDGPIFKTPVSFTKGEIVYREYSKPKENSTNCNTTNPDEKSYGFYFCDLIPLEK